MSISAAACHGYRSLGVAGVGTNPTLVSFAAWVRLTSTATNRSIIALDAADGASPDTGARFQISGSAGLKCVVATAGTTQQTSLEPARYFYESWYTGARPWVLIAGWIDTTQSAADGKLYVDGTTYVANGTDNIGNLGLLDDIYVLRASTVGTGWGASADSTESEIRAAYLTRWVGYKLTDADVTALKAGTHPLDIGSGASHRWCVEAKTAAGGLNDLVNSVALVPFGGSATATFFDGDNPTVSAPSGGGGATPAGLATETNTALALAPGLAGFSFDTATGLIFGDLAGALTSLARQSSVAMTVRFYSASTGALVHTSGTLTTDTNGRLARYTNAAFAAGTAYHCVFVRGSDGEIACAKLTAT